MNRLKFYLFKTGDAGLTEIPPIENYEAGNKDVISRESPGHYFSFKKGGKITLFREAYQFLREVNALHGVNIDVRLIIREKEEDTTEEDYITVSNNGIDLFTMKFNDSQQTVECDVITGGLLDLVEKRWDDEYDIMPDESIDEVPLSPLNTKQILLTPRQILRRSRLFVDNGTLVDSPAGPGDTARAIPLKVDFKSEDEVTSVVNTTMNSVSGDYADLQFSGATFLLNVKQDTTYVLNGTITIQNVIPITTGDITMDLVFFDNGSNLEYNGQKVQLDQATNPGTGVILTYTFTNYQLFVKAGQSVALATLVDNIIDNQYQVINDTYLKVQQDGTFPQTYTRGMRIGDMYDRVLARITGQEGLFTSVEYAIGGKYYDYFVAHGTWLRNVPSIINEGEEDEQEIQAKISLKFLWEACNLSEPMRYKSVFEGLTEKFYVGPEKETQSNDIGVRIGETRETFVLTEVSNVERPVLGGNYWGKIDIGSNKTGDDYEEVNNLYSICGNAQWNTVNKYSSSVYEIRSDIRTGAEDAELQRGKQYENNPDLDADFDEDWFLFDCKPYGGDFTIKGWQDYYAVAPTNVYSVDTNYNWAFTPARLLEGHGWKIQSGWPQSKYKNESLKFINSNCNKSLITQKSGEDPLQEGKNFSHTRLENATIYPMGIEFTHPVTQEIIRQLRKQDNLEKLVQFKSSDGVEFGRLQEVQTGNEGQWQLVEAKIN